MTDSYTVKIDGVLHYEVMCAQCDGKGAVEVIKPSSQGWDRFSPPSSEWVKCWECDGMGVKYVQELEEA